MTSLYQTASLNSSSHSESPIQITATFRPVLDMKGPLVVSRLCTLRPSDSEWLGLGHSAHHIDLMLTRAFGMSPSLWTLVR